MEDRAVSAGFAISLTCLVFASCWACHQIGYQLGYKKGEGDVLKAFADYVEAQRRGKLFK